MTQFWFDLCGLAAALAPTPEELCGKFVSRSRSVALPSVWSPGCAHKLINRERPALLQLEQSWDRHCSPTDSVLAERSSLQPPWVFNFLLCMLWGYKLVLKPYINLPCENIPATGLFFFFTSFFLLFFNHLTKWKQKTCTFKFGNLLPRICSNRTSFDTQSEEKQLLNSIICFSSQKYLENFEFQTISNLLFYNV